MREQSGNQQSRPAKSIFRCQTPSICLIVVIAVGISLSLTLAASASAEEAKPMTRVGNMMFVMPENWQRTDQDGGETVLVSPDSSQGQYFRIRIQPPSPLKKSLREQFIAEVADFGKKVEVVSGGDCTVEKKPGQFEIAMGLICWKNPKGAGENIATILCLAQVDQEVQPIVVVTNAGAMFTKHKDEIASFLDSIRFASRIVLVDGKRPLTQRTVNDVTDFLEWLIETPMTQQQRQQIQDNMIAEWKAGKTGEMDGAETFLKIRAQVIALSPSQQDVARKAMQPDIIAGLRKQDDDLSKMVLGAYNAAHKPIAAGNPPLTRQAADAGIELLYFMASQVLGGQKVCPDTAIKDAWARMMAEQHTTASPQTQETLARMPLTWAAIQCAWVELSDSKRQEARIAWANMPAIKQLAAHLGQLRTDAVATSAKDGVNMATALQKLQQKNINYQIMSNMLRMQHETNMAVIRNMSGNTYTYRYLKP